MKMNSLKMLSLLSGVAVLGSLTAQAQDKATLDLLVKKNVITQDEATALAKTTATPAIVTGPKDQANVKGLKIEGLFQSQFDWISTDDKAAGAHNPPAVEQFFIRRAYLGATVDMGNGWNGEIFFDFAAGTGANGGAQGGTARNNFEKIIISKKFDDYDGTLTTGYQKVNFTLEEVTSSAAVKPIERSVLTRYIDEQYNGGNTTQRLGFANQHTGIFWDGKIGDTGITYSAAVTTGIQDSVSYATTGGFNRLAEWASLAYGDSSNANLTYKTGVNFGISQDANSVTGTLAPPPAVVSQANSMWGFNPYVTFTYDKAFQLDAEYIYVSVDRGRGPAGATAGVPNQGRAQPNGFNITPSYMINDQWEVVARYSYLGTNGRGTNIADVARNGANIGATVFDNVDSWYVGLNYYILKNAVKFSLGYEYDEFTGRGAASAPAGFTGAKANVSGFRARMQMAF